MPEIQKVVPSVDEIFPDRTLADNLIISPDRKLRIAEMVTGLSLAATQDVPLAAVGALLFLKGLAGPEVLKIFLGQPDNLSK